MDAGLLGQALATLDKPTVSEFGDHFQVRSIVAVENDNRVLSQTVGLQAVDQVPNRNVHVLDHVLEVLQLLNDRLGRIPVVADWCRDERPVRQSHRVVNKGGFVAVLFEEVDRFLDPDVFAKLTRVSFQRTALPCFAFQHRWVGVARAFVFGVQGMEQRVVVKAGVLGMHACSAAFIGAGIPGRVVRLQLPFAKDRCCVTLFLHSVTKGLHV